MNLKDKVMFIGIGCYGGKQVKEFVENYGYKGIAVNGSEQDLRALGGMNKYHLKNFDGFGGHRERALECLEQNPDFLDYISSIEEEIIFLVFGGGGSTGSGNATIIAEMLLQEDSADKKIVCPVIALPSSSEPLIKHSNAYSAVQELQELQDLGLGATFFINNNVDSTYTCINSAFAKFLDTFLTNDSYGELNNFDEAERIEMLKDNGAMTMSLMKSGTDSTVMLDKLARNGIFAPIENKVCEHVAIIHAGNDNRDIEASSVISEVGKPQNVFEGYNGRSTLIACSGLDYPVEYVTKLAEMAKTAFEERKRERKQVKKLDTLILSDEKEEVKPVRKTSKFDVLKKRMNR